MMKYLKNFNQKMKQQNNNSSKKIINKKRLVVGTWNVDQKLTKTSISHWLNYSEKADIYAIGFYFV
jgi:hypothetical protein